MTALAELDLRGMPVELRQLERVLSGLPSLRRLHLDGKPGGTQRAALVEALRQRFPRVNLGAALG